MSPSIDVSPSVFNKLQDLAGPLFSVSEVIERLLGKDGTSPPLTPAGEAGVGRVPRERGAVVQIGPRRIVAVSVRDLYAQVLQWLVDEKVITKLTSAIPYRTSKQRYLISNKPIHPNGNNFVIPVEYKGYYMEAHKNYENAMSGLQQLGKLAGFKVGYVP